MTPSRGGEEEEVEGGVEELRIVVAEAACHIIGLVLAPISAAADQSSVLLASLSADQASVLFAPSDLTVAVSGSRSVAILPVRSAVSVSMLPVRFTMSVGIAPGVTPSGEPPSWEPLYTPALLIALRCYLVDGRITIAMGCTGDPTWRATEWSTLSSNRNKVNRINR
jgi:hypothetical protein